MSTHNQLQEAHFELKLWINELLFFKQEIGLYENYLGGLANKNTSNEMFAQLEHFQNQFIRQKEVNDELRHELKAHENHLEALSELNSGDAEGQHHHSLKEKVSIFKKIYGELKEDFYRFAATWDKK